MSVTVGKLVVCDRCGESVFVKYKGNKTFDGGYSSAPEFEPIPKDWGVCYPLLDKSQASKMLCPDCAKKWKSQMNAFFGLVEKEEK